MPASKDVCLNHLVSDYVEFFCVDLSSCNVGNLIKFVSILYRSNSAYGLMAAGHGDQIRKTCEALYFVAFLSNR